MCLCVACCVLLSAPGRRQNAEFKKCCISVLSRLCEHNWYLTASKKEKCVLTGCSVER